MSFRIPSLEEARRKQEACNRNALLPPLSFSASGQLASSASAASVHAASGGAAAGPTRTAIPPNPYAKRSTPCPNRLNDGASGGGGGGKGGGGVSATTTKTTTKTTTTAAAAAASGGGTRKAHNPYRAGAGAGTGGRKPLLHAPPPPGAAGPSWRPPSPSPFPAGRYEYDNDDDDFGIGPGNTFSQAFGSTADNEERPTASPTAVATATSRTFLSSSSSSPASRTDNGDICPIDGAAAKTTSSSCSQLPLPDVKDERIALQPHVLHVSNRQRGNPLLRFIRNVPWQYTNIIPDYICGPNRCALFLSLRYHNLKPTYVHRRISELGRDFDLRLLLIRVDVEDNASALLILNKLAVMNDLTLVLAWSDEECARYLETYKAYEGKDASSIRKKDASSMSLSFVHVVSDVLCAVRSVNRTDAAQLLGQFGTIRALANATVDDLTLCPGIGEKKVRRLWDALHTPFSTAVARKRKKRRMEQANNEKENDNDKGEDEEAAAAAAAAEKAKEDVKNNNNKAKETTSTKHDETNAVPNMIKGKGEKQESENTENTFERTITAVENNNSDNGNDDDNNDDHNDAAECTSGDKNNEETTTTATATATELYAMMTENAETITTITTRTTTTTTTVARKPRSISF